MTKNKPEGTFALILETRMKTKKHFPFCWLTEKSMHKENIWHLCYEVPLGHVAKGWIWTLLGTRLANPTVEEKKGKNARKVGQALGRCPRLPSVRQKKGVWCWLRP